MRISLKFVLIALIKNKLALTATFMRNPVSVC